MNEQAQPRKKKHNSSTLLDDLRRRVAYARSLGRDHVKVTVDEYAELLRLVDLPIVATVNPSPIVAMYGMRIEVGEKDL